MVAHWLRRVAVVPFALLALACSEESEDIPCEGTGPARCLDAFPPSLIDDNPRTGVTKLEWPTVEVSPHGPVCVQNETFRSFIRAAKHGSKDVSIYLANDGAWLPQSDYISLTKGRPPESLERATPTHFIAEDHPITGSSHLLYVPACDGSLFVGDRDYAVEEIREKFNPNASEARYYRGYINASSSVNELKRQYPDPERVFLIGSGAGSYGLLLLSTHVAESFPNAEILVIQDGAPGIALGRFDPEFTQNLIRDWGVSRSVPQDCSNCFDNGHITGLAHLALRNYPNMRLATFTSTNETAIPGIINLSNPKVPFTAEMHECFVQQEMGALKSAFPDRFHYFIVDGQANTVDGLTSKFGDGLNGPNYVLQPFDESEPIAYKDWLKQFVDNAPELRSVSEISLIPSTDPTVCR